MLNGPKSDGQRVLPKRQQRRQAERKRKKGSIAPIVLATVDAMAGDQLIDKKTARRAR